MMKTMLTNKTHQQLEVVLKLFVNSAHRKRLLQVELQKNSSPRKLEELNLMRTKEAPLSQVVQVSQKQTLNS